MRPIAHIVFLSALACAGLPAAASEGNIRPVYAKTKCLTAWEEHYLVGNPVFVCPCERGYNNVFEYSSEQQTLRFRNAFCLTAQDPEGADNPIVVSEWCSDEPNPNQRWKYNPQSGEWVSNGEGRMAEKCLDIEGGHSGYRVILFNCHNGSNQKWIVDTDVLP